MLSLAWPERMAQRRERGKFRLASGRGAELPPEDALADTPFLAVAAMDGGAQGTGRIHLAAPLDKSTLEELHGDLLREEDVVRWDDRTETVLARRRTLLGSLVLSDEPLRGSDLPGGQGALRRDPGRSGSRIGMPSVDEGTARMAGPRASHAPHWTERNGPT